MNLLTGASLLALAKSIYYLQSNPVKTDTEVTIDNVHFRVSVLHVSGLNLEKM